MHKYVTLIYIQSKSPGSLPLASTHPSLPAFSLHFHHSFNPCPSIHSCAALTHSLSLSFFQPSGRSIYLHLRWWEVQRTPPRNVISPLLIPLSAFSLFTSLNISHLSFCHCSSLSPPPVCTSPSLRRPDGLSRCSDRQQRCCSHRQLSYCRLVWQKDLTLDKQSVLLALCFFFLPFFIRHSTQLRMLHWSLGLSCGNMLLRLSLCHLSHFFSCWKASEGRWIPCMCSVCTPLRQY